jgi:hypothetical protein
MLYCFTVSFLSRPGVVAAAPGFSFSLFCRSLFRDMLLGAFVERAFSVAEIGASQKLTSAFPSGEAVGVITHT